MLFNYSEQENKFKLTTNKLKGHSEGKFISFNPNQIHSSNESDSLYMKKLLFNSIYSFRYVGSLVADFHRNLLKGGIFLYPDTNEYPNGKLRLCYECIPLAFIIKCSSGAATDGGYWILNKKPKSIHERSKLILGSENMVIDYLSFVFMSAPKVVGF